jgi:hypothetical protein
LKISNNQINSLAQGQVKTNSQVSSLTQALQAFIEAQTSSKNSPQGGNTEEGGSNGSSSTPTISASATPVGNPMAALHVSNLEITNKVETTKEHFGISGAAKFNLNKRIEELGFNPFVAPPENKKDVETIFQGKDLLPEIEAMLPERNSKDWRVTNNLEGKICS